MDVAFHPAGAWLVRTGGRPLDHLFVIRKGAVRLERDGQTLQVLEEGEVFGYTSLFTGEANLDVQVEEDLVAYRLPASEFRVLLEDPQFASHFAVGLAERLKSALAQSPVASFRTDLSLEVQQVAREPAVWVDADATVGEAARRMREEKASCVLVRGDPPGIVTDRDFRNRVLAEGLGPDARVASVATASPRTVRAGTRIYDAWSALLDAEVHHLPVVRGDEVVAVLTSTDLLRCSAQGPMAVLRRVERLHGRASLPGYGATVTEMASALLAGGLDATVIAGFVARLNDALVDRIVRMAEADLGAPPCRWAWLALGSEGRMEQTLLTDQDNALVWEAQGDAERAWFVAFADRVNADLEAAGFPRCPGGYMARSWNGTLEEWRRRFEDWIDAPSPDALLHGAIFFDFRRVAGTLALEPLEATLATRGEEARVRPLPRPRRPRLQAAAAAAPHPAREVHGGPEAARDRPGRVPRPLLRPRAGRARAEHPRAARARVEGGPAPGGRLHGRRGGVPVPARAPPAAAARAPGPGRSAHLDRAARRALRGRAQPGEGLAPGGEGAPGRGRPPLPDGLLIMFFSSLFSSPPWDSVVYWALDLETGGLHADRDPIIAVGMVPIRGGRVRLGESYRTLVRPADGRPIDPGSVRAHQLVWGEVKDAPTIAEVLPEVERRLGDGVLLVHHRVIDVRFLKDAYRRCGMKWPSPPVIDTVELLIKLAHKAHLSRPELPADPPALNLSAAREAHGLPQYQAHDALTDALATAELFLVLRHALGARTLKDLR